MSSVLQKITNLITGGDVQMPSVKQSSHVPAKITERDLLKQESKIGAELFGPMPKGRRREFFCLDESTWIWHEEWRDEKGVDKQSTVRYEVHTNGILKITDGPRYKFIEGDELKNFAEATRIYYERTAREIYERDPLTGAKLASTAA